jgi:N-acyl-D-amino-acid deacylase
MTEIRPDWVLRGGTIVDGTGGPSITGSVAITGDRISGISALTPTAPAGHTLDVPNCFVVPGFIDMHSHGDEGYLVVPDADSKVRQGITLDLCGNCGFSLAPCLAEKRDEARRSLARLEIEPTWEDLAGFRRRLEEHGVAINLAFLVGHGALRASTVGYADRPVSGEELAAMGRLLERELAAGATGLSTGLIYAPGCFAPTEEIIALARIARAAGGLYASHIRGEGATLLEAIDEALRIGHEAEIPVEVSHIKASGAPHWPKMRQALARIDAAREAGLSVNCDQYPYTASATSLSTVLPDWAHAGGSTGLLGRLREPAGRAQLLAALEGARAWDQVMVGSTRPGPLQRYQGETVAQVAAQWACRPEEAVLELLEEGEGQVGGIFFTQSEDNVRLALARPDIAVGTDSGVVSPRGITGQLHPHPRTYGTFPRILGRYVRDEQLLSWESAVHKMTGRAGATLNLPDRGRLATGYFADVVVFEPQTVQDRATFANPHQFPIGIRHVFVNGTPVVRDGAPTGARPGRVLSLR